MERDLFASCGSDRSIALYDIRAASPLRKVVMQKRPNRVAWNPQEAFNFTVASEDNNLYSFDMRRLDIASCVHKDFTSAVMDVDYSPTGREFAAASYDRSVRIFEFSTGRSREVYHTKRMQRVFAVRFSGDGAYVYSGSEDMNVRIWKAVAAAPLGTQLPREWKRLQYNKALVEKFKARAARRAPRACAAPCSGPALSPASRGVRLRSTHLKWRASSGTGMCRSRSPRLRSCGAEWRKASAGRRATA